MLFFVLKETTRGWWFLHCQIEPHQLEGMALVIEKPAGMPPVPWDFPQCGNYPTGIGSPLNVYELVTIALGCLSGALLLLMISLVIAILGCYCYRRKKSTVAMDVQCLTHRGLPHNP